MSKEVRSLKWEKQFCFTCKACTRSFPGDGRTLSGWAARTVTRRPEHRRWSKALLAQVVCRAEAQLATRSAGPATGLLDTKSCGKIGTHGLDAKPVREEAVHTLTSAQPG